MIYKIGQILTSKEDMEIEKELSGEKVFIPKGNRVIIGADNLAHHFKHGFVQPLSKNIKVEKYDTKGLAEYLYLHLIKHLEIDEMLDDYNDTKERFMEEIECALEEIGF